MPKTIPPSICTLAGLIALSVAVWYKYGLCDALGVAGIILLLCGNGRLSLPVNHPDKTRKH